MRRSVRQRLVIPSLVTALAMFCVATVMGAAFSDGSFEAASPGTAGSPWTAGGGGINWVSGWQSADGTPHSIDLNHDSLSSPGGTIAQTFDTESGRTYTVSFAVAGNPTCGGDVGNNNIKTVKATA